MANNTLNILLKAFEDIATAHKQINSFGIGELPEIGASNALTMPALWINPVEAVMAKNENGYSVATYEFNVRVFDLVDKGEENENDVLSDTIQVLQDIVSEFNSNPTYAESNILIQNDLTFEPFSENYDEEVSGWEVNMELTSPRNDCYLDKPL